MGEVVQHRVPEHEVKRRVGERQALRVACHRLNSHADPLRVGLQRVEHPR